MEPDLDRLTRIGLTLPEILLPSDDVDPQKWSVIACDQHTSDRNYWAEVQKIREDSPSTLDLIFPEVYLEDGNEETRIASIQKSMKQYLSDGILKSRGKGWIYVRRETAGSGLREGIVLAVDLEHYDFSKGSTSLIRATEGTILERLPPRIRIRENALLETPHIMILIDDREKSIIESLGAQKDRLECVYDLDLMLDGGHLQGFWIDDARLIDNIAAGLEQLADSRRAKELYGNENPLLFAMGDGNHSLATAKSVWESQKTSLSRKGISQEQIMGHPARFALAEIVNIYSPGLRFEPIHRCIFDCDAPAFIEKLATLSGNAPVRLSGEEEARKALEELQNPIIACSGGEWLLFEDAGDLLAPGRADEAFSFYIESGGKGRIDFIHGWEHTRRIVEQNQGSLGLFFKVIPREELFSYVISHGALPRKAFSMGEAEEKRYYYEVRKVRPD